MSSYNLHEQLQSTADAFQVDLFHLERIVSILDAPTSYGIRLEFLDIEMSKEEQIAFIADRDKLFQQIQYQFDRIVDQFEKFPAMPNIPLAEIEQFRRILNSISGYGAAFAVGGHIHHLQVPLEELQEFARLLNQIAGPGTALGFGPHVYHLRVPVDELHEYEQTLDRIIEKLEKMRALTP